MILLLALSDGFPILAQDCNGVGIIITGTVRDTAQMPIVGAAVHVKPLGTYFYTADVPEETVNTDEQGHFEIVNFPMFVCDEVVIEASAEGFQSASTTRAPFDEYPNLESIAQPLLFEANFTLRRTP